MYFKKYVLPIAKFALAVGIIGYLLTTIDRQELSALSSRSKNWPLLATGLACCMTAVCVTFARWYLLVRTLDLPFTAKEAFRLGFLGYLLNFVSLGSVGGDLFKAFFIARDNPGRRTEAVSTVIVDRLFGLYMLLVMTSIALIVGGAIDKSPEVATIAGTTFAATIIGAIGIAFVLTPWATAPRIIELIRKVPIAGGPLSQFATAMRVYRTRPLTLIIGALLSLSVHSLFAIGIFSAAQGIYPETPTLTEHMVIVPLSMVAGALPATPAGLGTFEAAMDQLYAIVPAVKASSSAGVIVALVYRLITIVIAAIGGCYYVAGRREVQELLHEAELEASG